MTQDQRNAFVKLVEQVKGEFRNRRAVPYYEEQQRKADAERKLEVRYGLPALRKRHEKAHEVERAAERKVDEVNQKIRRELDIIERKESREFERKLEVFTGAVAEVLAVDDAKDAQKVIERLMAL